MESKLYVLYHCGKMKSLVMTTKVLLLYMYLSGKVSTSGQEVKGNIPSCGMNSLGPKHRELAGKKNLD